MGKVVALHAGGFQIGQKPFRAARIVSGHDQRAPAKIPGDGADTIDRTGTENDAGGGGKFKFHNTVLVMQASACPETR